LDNPSLLRSRPPSPALATHQYRSRRHGCSLICQLLSKLPTRDRERLGRGSSDAYRRPARRHLEDGIVTQPVEVVGVLVAGRNRKHPKPKHLLDRVLDEIRIALVLQAR